MLKLGIRINPKQCEILGSNSGSHIYEIHMSMFLQATTRDCKQYNIPEYHTGVYHKGGRNANGRSSIFEVSYYFDVSHDYVMKVMLNRKQCFCSKCHISDIDIDKLSFKNTGHVRLSPATPSQAQLCVRYFRCSISVLNVSKVNLPTFL